MGDSGRVGSKWVASRMRPGMSRAVGGSEVASLAAEGMGIHRLASSVCMCVFHACTHCTLAL